METQRTERRRALVLVIRALALSVALAPATSAQVTTRVNLDPSGGQANGSTDVATISSDSRFIAFESDATNLVPGDTNTARDVFVRDLLTGTNERVSVATGGAQANNSSGAPFISADGRYVGFESDATNLVSGDTNGMSDVFVHDRQNHTTERIDVSSGGAQANSGATFGSISADGRFAVFTSYSDNLVPTDTNGGFDVFVRDLLLGTTELASVATGGAQANGSNYQGILSSDGRFVVFESEATNLGYPNPTGVFHVFVHDRLNNTTDRSSQSTSGTEGNTDSLASSISDDGRFVVFFSQASNLVPGDTNGVRDTFIRDRQAGVTERISVDTDGSEGDVDSMDGKTSADGRYVAFWSRADNFGYLDTNDVADIYVRDRQRGTTGRVSLSSGGAQGEFPSYAFSITADGRYVEFVSRSPQFVPLDTNGVTDVFLRDREYVAFAQYCSPGVGEVAPCPCTLPAATPGRGCNNSFGTGGARLEGDGVAYLSADSLHFTTSGETWFGLSVFMQGTAAIPGGAILGQGVHCVGGALKRLYVKSAFYGAAEAPESGDLPVSARSAALGDVIQAGQSRYYAVVYRDPVVPPGCPSTSTFNTTETGVVFWSQ